MNNYDTWDEYYLATGKKPKTIDKKIYWSATKQCYIRRKDRKMAKTATIKRRDNAPAFVFGSFGYKYSDLIEYVNDKGYINFDILSSKDGENYYVKVNDYKPKNESVTKSDTDTVMEFEEMPF